jgi:hypothetical protein
MASIWHKEQIRRHGRDEDLYGFVVSELYNHYRPRVQGKTVFLLREDRNFMPIGDLRVVIRKRE